MYDPTLGQFLSEDPIMFAGLDENLRRYVGNHPTYATDPSGLAELRLPQQGTWMGEVGNSGFRPDDASLPIVYFRNNVPDFTPWIHNEKGIPGVIDIQLSCNLAGGVKAMRDADEAAANAAMQAKYPGWEKPPGYTWHHQMVNGNGKGQMILVRSSIHNHKQLAHTGAFAIWKNILKARQAGDAKALRHLHSQRRGLFRVAVGEVAGKGAGVGRKIPGVKIVFGLMAFSAYQNAWANDGCDGVGKQIVYDTVPGIEEFENGVLWGSEFVGDQLMIDPQGDEYRERMKYGDQYDVLYPGGRPR